MHDELLHIDDEVLTLRIKAGDLAAFDLLYKRYYSRLYRFAFSILKSVEDSENIVQDTFLALLENIHKLEKDTLVKYYIFTIAHNSTISLIRKRLKENKFIEYLRSIQSEEEDPVYSEDEHLELIRKVGSIINQLPDRQREVYLLHRMEKLKYKEIAERLDISVNTVENHISRALKLIRGKIGNSITSRF